MLEKLKQLLEGKKVISLNDSKKRDSICEFVVQDNNGFKSYFTLCCTDLGPWITNEKDENNGFVDVKQMFEEIFEHSNEDSNDEHTFEVFDDSECRIIGFRCKKCKKEFCVSITTIKKSEYARFFETSELRKRLAKVLSQTYILNVNTLIECLK